MGGSVRGGARSFGEGPVGSDFYAAGGAGGPVIEAAPWPVFWFLDEFADHRVAVHVFELFYELVVSEDIEIVVAGLPEVGAGAFEFL